MRGTNQTVVEPGEVKQLVSQDESPTDSYVSVTGANCFMGRTPEQARAEFRYAPKDDRGRMKTVKNESVWVYNPSSNANTATVVRDKAGFFWDREPREVVRAAGADGEAVETTIRGSVETDNYEEGGAFDSSAYPVTVDPPETIEEFLITKSPAGSVVDITTVSGTTFTFPLDGATGTFDKWSIDSLSFRDPSGSGDPIKGGWAGE